MTILTALIFLGTFFASTSPVVLALQLTATPAADAGMYITVITDEPQINVRMGPSSSIYPIVGTLPTGSTAPALGRSPGGDWIQIEYAGAPNNAGWVYSPLVQVSPGTLRIVEP
ncbi:MAG: SH3 domain-containing protein, partial [Anaerolineales bacterium]|nr:SH3 domain-containing protein [Anaerolineales bacterium]